MREENNTQSILVRDLLRKITTTVTTMIYSMSISPIL